MKKIIGLVGETGSGKDAFCNYAKRISKNVFCFRFSDFLSEALKVFFEEVKKEDQQWLAMVLRKRFGNDILGEAISRKIKNIKKGVIILNGMRTFEEYEILRRMGAKIVYVTADFKKRWQRVNSRRERKMSSRKKFLKSERAKTEILIPKIGKKADFKIENNGSKKDFFKQVEKIIKNAS